MHTGLGTREMAFIIEDVLGRMDADLVGVNLFLGKVFYHLNTLLKDAPNSSALRDTPRQSSHSGDPPRANRDLRQWEVSGRSMDRDRRKADMPTSLWCVLEGERRGARNQKAPC